MVNYGVSRGCAMCKQRRKKCDETRPACNRCVKSRRVCPGYQDDATLLFRHYEPPRITYKSPVCWWSPEVPDDELERRAIDIFLAEFVVESHDRKRSRGFLDGMQFLLLKVQPDSALVSAAKIVVLASIGNRTERNSLRKRAQIQYGQLLQTFTKSLSHKYEAVTIENLFTAVLLGFYEIIVSDAVSPMRHKAHVEGVCAFIKGGMKLFDCTRSVEFYSVGNPLLLKKPMGAQAETAAHYAPISDARMGVLCAPIKDGSVRSLDVTLIKFSPLFARAESLLKQPSPSTEELRRLESDLLAINDEFMAWGANQVDNWAPTRVGRVDFEGAEASSCSYCREGPVDSYFDYFVAAVWNTWRKAQMLYVDVLAKLAKLLGREEAIPGLEERARVLSAAIIASVPYHLAADLDEYLRLANAGASNIPPNRPVGGLLLLHPLYTAARCTVIPQAHRDCYLNALAWIGKYMGIGQATLLANSLKSELNDVSILTPTDLPFMDMGEGHILIWAGMMLAPTSTASNDSEKCVRQA